MFGNAWISHSNISVIVRLCPWLCIIRLMQLCWSIILKFSTTFESSSRCQTDCQVELALFWNLCLFSATSWSCILQTLLDLRRWHMENYLRNAHFRTKADYKSVSIVLVAHSKEQKSNSWLSSIPSSCSRIHQNAIPPKGHFRLCSLACIRAGNMEW